MVVAPQRFTRYESCQEVYVRPQPPYLDGVREHAEEQAGYDAGDQRPLHVVAHQGLPAARSCPHEPGADAGMPAPSLVQMGVRSSDPRVTYWDETGATVTRVRGMT